MGGGGGQVMRIAQMMEAEGYRGKGASLSGIGGVETGGDAAEFLLLGANTVQVGGGKGGELEAREGEGGLGRSSMAPPRLVCLKYCCT